MSPANKIAVPEGIVMKTNAIRALLALAFLPFVLVQPTAAWAEDRPATSIPTPDLIQPADLAASLQKNSTPRPLILHVGFHVLYAEAHIPGSEYAGPSSEMSGLKILRDRVAKLPKDTSIVIYCGCCPWIHCPNVAAAYDALRSLGFAHLKVLYIAENFGTNWVDRGYPVSKGG